MLKFARSFVVLAFVMALMVGGFLSEAQQIGQEISVPRHLVDGEEYELPMKDLLDHGSVLFSAIWTSQEGGGRPLSKGTGAPLSDPDKPLEFPRSFNRISGPDSNSCAGCHTQPFGIAGGGGDIVANVFVLGQRFDFADFAHGDRLTTRGNRDEQGKLATLDQIANSRATIGMFGSGYIEMLAREMTTDLLAIRDRIGPGEEALLVTKGVEFGTLARRDNGIWDMSRVEGLPSTSLESTGPDCPPDLIVQPFHQVGAVISLREFTNNAYNHHHGIQSAERFGEGSDPDDDGFTNELTRADVTAVVLYQATLAVPGRVIPRNPVIEDAVLRGERSFEAVGCASCHVPSLPLSAEGRNFTEPNPFNDLGDLQVGNAPELGVDLNSDEFPTPRLQADAEGVTWVPAFTDLKLHDITEGPDDPNREHLDQIPPVGSRAFFFGNGRFLTKKLWGAANEPPYYHHGKYTTLREATLAHAGEAEQSADAFRALPNEDQDCVIEFLKTLQVLPPGTKSLVVDERGEPREWPPR